MINNDIRLSTLFYILRICNTTYEYAMMKPEIQREDFLLIFLSENI